MFLGLLSFGGSFTHAAEVSGRIEWVCLNNQSSQVRPTFVDKSSNEPLNYLFVVSVNKYVGSCNTIDDPYDQVCVPNKVKNINLKPFN